MAILWPDGLRLLIANGLQADSLDNHGYSALDAALGLGLNETVQILSRLQVSLVTPHTWYQAGNFYQRTNISDVEKSKVLFSIAAQISECSRMIRKTLINDFTRPESEEMYKKLYHQDALIAAGAEALFQHGFTEVDVYVEGLETPLWYHIRFICFSSRLGSQLALIQWLHDKNVSLDTPHPRFNNFPSHALISNTVHNVFQQIFPEKDRLRRRKLEDFEEIEIYLSKAMPEIQSFILRFPTLSSAVHDKNRDRCVCYCSKNGCDVVTSMLIKSSFLDWWSIWWSNPRSYITISKKIISGIFGFVGIHLEEDPELRNSALRIMTFEVLEMTHTCHLNGNGPSFAEEDLLNIHNIEEEDIMTLEILLDYFEKVWPFHDGTFLEFLEFHWEPHMAKVLAERSVKPIDQEVLKDHNIALGTPGCETNRRADFGEFTWFQRVVEAIADNREIADCDQIDLADIW